MFDIGFTEMMFIAVVALVVIGPERLPKVARTIGHLFGRAQRYVSDVKSEINREMEIDELRKLQAEMQTAARKVETDFTQSVRDTEASIKQETRLEDIEKDVNQALTDTANAHRDSATSGTEQSKDNQAGADALEAELDKAIAQAEELNAANDNRRVNSKQQEAQSPDSAPPSSQSS